jgi:GH15 family glucan-1,4-alpha-glucosidase
VRIGNGAATQLQLDIYGEALDSIHLADSHDLQTAHEGWQSITHMMDWLCDHWDQGDDGIWETHAAAGRTSSTDGSCPGSPSTGQSGSLRVGDARPTSDVGPTCAT